MSHGPACSFRESEATGISADACLTGCCAAGAGCSFFFERNGFQNWASQGEARARPASRQTAVRAIRIGRSSLRGDYGKASDGTVAEGSGGS